MEKHHELMGGNLQLFRRPNSTYWYCQASVGGKQRRMSTKKESLKLAKDVATDWFLTLQGKDRAGLLLSEPTFAQAAKKFMAEYETITQGQRSPKWVEGHRARIRLHLIPFFEHVGLSRISAGMAQDYRVHRSKIGVAPRGGNMKTTAKPDPTSEELKQILLTAQKSGQERRASEKKMREMGHRDDQKQRNHPPAQPARENHLGEERASPDDHVALEHLRRF